MELSSLEKELGYVFQKKDLLKNALTHTSYAYENKIDSNEKLEFLGDSVLEFVSSEYLFNNYKNLTEGEMSKVRATVVCEDSLKEVAKKHHFENYMFVGKSEQPDVKGIRPAILADCVEAVIAAIFLDGGIQSAKKFIIKNLKQDIENATKHIGQKDYKTVLQETLQHNGNAHIEYKIIAESGPDHDKTFTSEVIYNGKILASGIGKSKKHAEMDAAKKALENMHEN